MGARIGWRFHQRAVMLHIGFEAYVAKARVLAILPNKGSGARRLARASDPIDMTRGRACKSLIVLDTGAIVRSPLTSVVLVSRWQA